MERIYYLYCLIDPELKIPKYIGISNNPERRYKEHLEDISNTSKTRWIKSLVDKKLKPILKSIKNTQDIHQVIEWEKKAISKYKDIYDLVNSTNGGEYYAIGTPILEFDLQGNYIDSYTSMIEYCELHSWDPNRVAAISAVCLRKRNYCYNKIFRYLNDEVTKEDLDRLSKEFHRRDPQHFIIVSLEGEILGEFDSFQEAEKQGFGSYSSISMALKNSPGYASVKGNLICYTIDEYEQKLKNYRIAKTKGKEIIISKYDLNGNYIDTYYSIKDARESISLRRDSIKLCCEGKQQQCGGYQWRYGNSKENIGKYVKTYNLTKPRGSKKIIQYSLNNEQIKIWNSANEIEEILGISAKSVRRCASGDRKTYNNFIWKYMEAV